MFLRIDVSSGTPIYVQVVKAVQKDIALGRLRPDDALPSVRQLALDLSVNPNTVAQAYRALEQDGVVYTRRGHGTFVARLDRGRVRAERKKAIAARVEDALIEGMNMGLGEPELRAMCGSLLDRLMIHRRRRETALARD